MTKRGHGRFLSHEERELWEQVARSANPLKPRPVKKAEAQAEESAPSSPKARPVRPPAVPKRPKEPIPAQAPAAIDRRTRSRLSRGILDVDATLDLHGMTQAVAHGRLRRFLEDAQAHGVKLVLVITGKGKPGLEVGERGVLKRAVPAWLESSAFRPLVAGYDDAGRRHGGGGALYVRLRRKR